MVGALLGCRATKFLCTHMGSGEDFLHINPSQTGKSLVLVLCLCNYKLPVWQLEQILSALLKAIKSWTGKTRKDIVDFCKGESKKGQENVRKAREGHFGYILTEQFSQTVSQVSSHSSHPSGHCSGGVRSETLLLLREGELFVNQCS